MKFYNWVIRYRHLLAVACIIGGVALNIYAGFWAAFFLYLTSAIAMFSHFFFGPLRLIQASMEQGDMEGAEKVLNSIKFPNLLCKSIRSVYSTLEGILAMMKLDFASAEKHI